MVSNKNNTYFIYTYFLFLRNLVTPSYAANYIALHNNSYDSIFEIQWEKRKLIENVDEDEEMPELISYENYDTILIDL